MSDHLTISAAWLQLDHGLAAERATFGDVTVTANGRALTESEDLVAKTVQPSARLSAVYLARWLVGNWWRLRVESRTDTQSWRMSHHVAAAGGGYAWPDIVIDSDGSSLALSVQPTQGSRNGIVRYLARYRTEIPLSAFDAAIDRFVPEVIGRLDRLGEADHELAEAWRWLHADRQSPELAKLRRLEAILGFDWGEPPSPLVDQVAGAAAEFGIVATAEVAAAARAQAPAVLAAVPAAARQARYAIEVPTCEAISAAAAQSGAMERPWQRASRAAKAARDAWHIAAGPITDRQLASLLGCPFDTGRPQLPPAPISFVWRDDSGRAKVALHRPRPTSQRFDLARLVGDHFWPHASEEPLAPATLATTARQKFQRAFAQEFLCPFDELRARLGPGTAADEAIEDVAKDYMVSPLVVQTVLVNRGLADRAALGDFAAVDSGAQATGW